MNKQKILLLFQRILEFFGLVRFSLVYIGYFKAPQCIGPAGLALLFSIYFKSKEMGIIRTQPATCGKSQYYLIMIL